MKENHFLLQALALAQEHRGFCAPNPSVGAVIVGADGNVLATGYHLGAGHAHAEVDALKKLKGKANNATIYITLQPCCHWGKTPPCTDALIQAGIKRVVYGFRDPNPLVLEKSTEILAAANIQCEYLPLAEIAAFYASYHYWQTNKKPFITAKIALSLDGKIADENGKPREITGLALKELTYYHRKHSDAILTTVKTIICDDPQMNVRSTSQTIAKPVYILDRELRLPLQAKILSTAKSITLFHEKNVSTAQLEKLAEKNIRCIAIDTKQNQLDLISIIEHIGRDGMHDLWVEAGGVCFSAFVRQKLLQRALIYIAPRWLGTGLNAFDKDFRLDTSSAKINWQQVGSDAVCQIEWVNIP